MLAFAGIGSPRSQRPVVNFSLKSRLLKRAWLDNQDFGLVHRSPNVSNRKKQLWLRLDFN
jgi:hypothetical protein